MATSELATAPARPAWRQRTRLWWWSNRNLLGLALACIGPALRLAGLIGPGWLAITAGLYAIGVLLAPSSPKLERRLADDLDHEALAARLDELSRQAAPALAASSRQHLESICRTVHELLPRLAGALAGDEHAYTVRETIIRYLPETLANYVALPTAFRLTCVVQDGRTARQLLDEQLALLDQRLQEISRQLAEGDAQALLAHGRFLQDRFGRAEFGGL